MPWKMLAYPDRTLKGQLSQLFGVQGIPTLVLASDEEGLITDEGREAIMTTPFEKLRAFGEEKRLAQERRDAEKKNFKPSVFFAEKEILDKKGEKVPASSLHGKLVGLYFSAHWCPPCRGFTPVLAKKYEEIVGKGHAFEVVFISSDSDDNSAKEYFAEMPWKMLSFSDQETNQKLSDLFDIQGIPTLVLVSDEEGLITDDGREAITSSLPFDKLRKYPEAKIEEEKRLAEEIKGFPESVKIEQHAHELKKMATVYRGSYGCDLCGAGGKGWAYHCNECSYDAHPHCVVKK